MQTDSIGQILLRETELTAEQLDMALRTQQTRRPHTELGNILLEKGFITTLQLYQGLAQQWDIPYMDTIAPEKLGENLLKKLPLDFLKKQALVPVVDNPGEIAIAMANPMNVQAYDAVQNILGQHCRMVISPATEIEKAISHCYYQQEHADTDEKNVGDTDDNSDSTIHTKQEDLLNIANNAPIVKLVNTILFQAANSRASDIHIEPYEKQVKIRFRIDGVLHDSYTLPRHQVTALTSRLKIMADLNIAERRLPQDGQSRIKIGEKEMDIRVSTIPTSGGERVVLRLLDKGGPGLSMSQLGFAEDTMAEFTNVINAPHGIVLLTGPTGSGKTSTLYCAINELNNDARNILTVEDPIEYQLPGVGQMQIKPKIDLTFANCLRHILRQDPDVIMIGEIRDAETAEIAIHASLTGHLVLSTLHTNDSASAVTRLVDMGIEPYLISSSVSAVMAQRLLRLICPQCKTACKIEGNLQAMLGATATTHSQFYTGAGCEDCLQTGYYGRAAISELLIFDEKIKDLVTSKAPTHLIKEAAVKNGMRTLRLDGLRQARNGSTTIEEVLRVTQEGSSIDMGIQQNV